MCFKKSKFTNSLQFIVVIISASFMLTGCVTPIPVTEEAPNLSYKSTVPMVVAVVDDREYLKEGKKPSYIGRAHGVYGIPSNMHAYPWLVHDKTKKKQSLALALEERIVEGLNDDGWQLTPADITNRPTKEEAKSLMADNNAQRFLLLTLTDWWVSINMNWVSDFDFEWGYILELLDTKGDVIISTTDAGTDLIDEEHDQSYQNHVKLAFRDRLIKILEQPELVAALTGKTYTPSVSARNKPQAEKAAIDTVPEIREVDATEKTACELVSSIKRSSGGSGDGSIYVDRAMNSAIAEAEKQGADAYFLTNLDIGGSGASVELEALKCN